MRKVGLFCSTKFHYFIYENIMNLIPNDYVMVTPISEENGDLVDFLEEKGCQVIKEDAILTSKISIDLLISPYWRPSFEIYPVHIQMVRMMYGYAKDDWNYAEWNGNYDLILAYGPYALQKLQEYNCLAVGNPRSLTPDEQQEPKDWAGRPISGFLQMDKPTILYAPTWGDLSSYDEVLPHAKELAKCYNFIFKAHHLLEVDDESDLSVLAQDAALFYCDEQCDIFSLFPFVDLLVSDYSGAIFDGIVSGVPVVLLNNREQTTGEGQLEGRVREFLKVVQTESVPFMQEEFEHVMRNEEYLKMMAMLREQLFSNTDDKEEIVRLIQSALADERHRNSRNLKNNKLEMLHELFNDDIQDVVICGCGEYGKGVATLLHGRNIPINCFMDNYSREKTFARIPIVTEREFFETQLSANTFFLVATRSGVAYFTDLLVEKGIDVRNILKM